MAVQENTLQNWTLVDILQNLHKPKGRGMQHWYFYHLWPSWFIFGLSQPKVIWLAKTWIQASTRYKVNQITEDHIPSGVTEKTRKLQYCSYFSNPHHTQIVLFRKASCPRKTSQNFYINFYSPRLLISKSLKARKREAMSNPISVEPEMKANNNPNYFRSFQERFSIFFS